MRPSLLLFIAAALSFVAAALSTFNDGGTAQTGAGVAIGCAMLVLGFNLLKPGKLGFAAACPGLAGYLDRSKEAHCAT